MIQDACYRPTPATPPAAPERCRFCGEALWLSAGFCSKCGAETKEQPRGWGPGYGIRCTLYGPCEFGTGWLRTEVDAQQAYLAHVKVAHSAAPPELPPEMLSVLRAGAIDPSLDIDWKALAYPDNVHPVTVSAAPPTTGEAPHPVVLMNGQQPTPLAPERLISATPGVTGEAPACTCPFPRAACPACSHPCLACATVRGDAVEMPREAPGVCPTCGKTRTFTLCSDAFHVAPGACPTCAEIGRHLDCAVCGGTGRAPGRQP